MEKQVRIMFLIDGYSLCSKFKQLKTTIIDISSKLNR